MPTIRPYSDTADPTRHYRRAAHYNVTHARRQQFYALPRSQWELLAAPPISYLDTLNRVDDAIDANADIADAILDSALASLGLQGTVEWEGTTTKIDLDKARSTLHQLYRDWSAEGRVEREACYEPVLKDLETRFGDLATSTAKDTTGANTPRILVPGAGLGRLVFELAQAGFDAEGNELSYHQLFTSSYMLNHTTSANQHKLYPFAHTFSNHLSRADQMVHVSVPDVHPASCHLKGSMSMTTGDFTHVYEQEEYADSFDAVATVFFVDTAPNLLRYVETVKRCLRKGGWWVNVGPLLWHFGEKEKETEKEKDDEEGGGQKETSKQQNKIGVGGGSVQLTNEEVVKIVEMSGFEIEVNETEGLSTGYVQNQRSMLLNTYKPSHWVARKM